MLYNTTYGKDAFDDVDARLLEGLEVRSGIPLARAGGLFEALKLLCHGHDVIVPEILRCGLVAVRPAANCPILFRIR